MSLKNIEQNGVIGAGGAGFPAHVKLDSRPDTIIMNAAECEPLLHKDMEIILNHTHEVISGLLKTMEITGAKKGIIGIKDKRSEQIKILNQNLPENIEVVEVPDVYPAGDEIVLIHMTTGRVVQAGALPISQGCVVQNVETLYNIGIGKAVVEKFISVAGAVEQPATLRVPVGISFKEILSQFKITTDDYIIRVGGLMMGYLENNQESVVSKRTGALIVLPKDHHTVKTYERFSSDHITDIIAKAACDQCNFCTEFCPRYLLGQPVRPETAMRNRMFTREEQPMVFAGNVSCCECNLCTMYACPEGLDPAGATRIEKRLSIAQGLSWDGVERGPHPMNEYRRVPTKKLMQKLDVLKYRDEGPLSTTKFSPKEVKIPLAQHSGAPAEAIVSIGDQVKKYDLIAKANGWVSSNIHASICGRIKNISKTEIVISADE